MLCRENLLNELMRETNEVLIRRQRIQETLEVLEQAHRVFTVSSMFIFLSFLQCFNICIFRHLRNFLLKLKRLRRATTLLDMQLGYQKSMDSARIAQMACTHHPLIATVYTKHLI